MSDIEAILLDAGGVLVLPNAEAIIGELAKNGIEIDPALMPRAHYAGMRGMDLDTSGEFRWSFYNREYVRALEIPDEQVDTAREAVDRAFASAEWNVVIEESVRAFPALSVHGAHLAIVSNSDGSVERILRSMRLAQLGPGEGLDMVAIVDSHVVGLSKPDPKIFHHALEILGVAPERAVHVGDSVRFDVLGAKAAGVRPLHFDPFGLCTHGDHEHIGSLADVVELV